MKAIVNKPLDKRSFDNTAVNFCIFLAVLHERSASAKRDVRRS